MLNPETDEDDMKNPVCSFLALVLTLLLLTATPGTSGTSDDSDVAMNITAVLGHSVTFKCPSTHGKPVKGLYIQRMKNDKEEVFINGFYKGRHVQVNPEYQNRTQVNEMELSMEMRNISVSDEGLYKCYVFNNILNTPDITLEILLKVTAEYRNLTIKKDCIKRNDGSSGESCQLSCSAVGGYPQSTFTWTGFNSSVTSLIWNSEDNVSKTWTTNQTFIFNCDQPISVSCAIGGAVSHTITICEKESFSLQVIIAIIVVLGFVLLILVIIVIKCCCRRSETRRSEDRVDGADVPLADCHSQLENVTTKP